MACLHPPGRGNANSQRPLTPAATSRFQNPLWTIWTMHSSLPPTHASAVALQAGAERARHLYMEPGAGLGRAAVLLGTAQRHPPCTQRPLTRARNCWGPPHSWQPRSGSPCYPGPAQQRQLAAGPGQLGGQQLQLLRQRRQLPSGTCRTHLRPSRLLLLPLSRSWLLHTLLILVMP